MIKYHRYCVTLFSLLCAVGCSSSSPEGKSDVKGAKLEETSDNKPAQKTAPAEEQKPDEESFRASSRSVTTVLNNSDSAIEGAVPDSVLADVLMSMEQMSSKKSRDLGFMVTYLGIARLQGRNIDLQKRLEEKIGPMGAKNPWFLLEASYGALQRKNYALAEYLLAKAEKLAAADKVAKAAVSHAMAVRYFIAGKIQTAVNEMRKINGEIQFLPTSLTLGFLALRAGDFSGAESVFRSASMNNPDNINIKIGLAAAFRGKGQAQEAITLLKPVYESMGQDRRIVWNYVLALSDNAASKEEAISTLKKYFQLPGSLPDADAKANALLAKLQRPPAPPPAPKPMPAPAAGKDAAAKPNPAPKEPAKEGSKAPAAPAAKPGATPAKQGADEDSE